MARRVLEWILQKRKKRRRSRRGWKDVIEPWDRGSREIEEFGRGNVLRRGILETGDREVPPPTQVVNTDMLYTTFTNSQTNYVFCDNKRFTQTLLKAWMNNIRLHSFSVQHRGVCVFARAHRSTKIRSLLRIVFINPTLSRNFLSNIFYPYVIYTSFYIKPDFYMFSIWYEPNSKCFHGICMYFSGWTYFFFLSLIFFLSTFVGVRQRRIS